MVKYLRTAREDETSLQLSTQITSFFFQKEALKNESDSNVRPFYENNALTSAPLLSRLVLAGILSGWSTYYEYIIV